MTNNKYLLQQDDAAPDSKQVFANELSEQFKLTIKDFYTKGKETKFEMGSSWEYKGYILEWYADDPWFKLSRKKHNLKLPKGYLSFSQIELWEKAPETYRKKYYGGVKYGSSTAMMFGNEVTDAMENNEEWVAFIPRYPLFERELLVDIDGIPVLAYVDNSKPETNAFREQKTGKTPWTEKKVARHMQLDLYSLLLKEQDGFVQDECILVWVKTEKKRKSVVFDGIELFADEIIPSLTGEFVEFKRVITESDRQAMRERVVKAGRAIEEDFAAFKHLYQ